MVEQQTKIGNYFLRETLQEDLIPSGSVLLDCLIGGGWPLGRIVNIYGKQSTSKTGLVVEAAANFRRKFPEGNISYHEAEAAFDEGYAALLGMPVDSTHFIGNQEDDTVDPSTIEGFHHYLYQAIEDSQESQGLYVLDSLDALSDRAEKGRDIGDDTYGANKAKQMSALFRRIMGDIKNTNLLLMIICQTRDKISAVPFGKKYSKSGGKALDFYASLVLYLNELKKITKEVSIGDNGKIKIKKPVGIWIKVSCEKSKVALPYREVELPILFGYGIHSPLANLHWLKSVGAANRLSFKTGKHKVVADEIVTNNDTEKMAELDSLVRTVWNEIEKEFIPLRGKYD